MKTKIEEKLAARAEPVGLALRRHGLEECGTCRWWHAATKSARAFHENRCPGTTYANAKEA